MSQNDDELNNLLKPLRTALPNDLQMHNWKLAVQRELDRNPINVKATRGKWALQMLAAMFVGAVLGAVLSAALYRNILQSAKSPLVAQNIFDDATFERSHANLD